MGARGAVVVLLLLVSVIAAVPRPAAAANPAVTNVTWAPWVPARGEMLTIEADVSDTDNVTSVSAAYCVIPPFTCNLYPFSLVSGTNRSGHWSSGATILIVPLPYFGEYYYGAYFNVTAVDELGFNTTTEKDYVQYGDAIDVRASLSQSSVPPGDALTVSGAAVYQWYNETGFHANESAPAKYSAVQVRIVETGGTWSGTSDGSGAFSVAITAPAQTGSYTVNVTVSNRTIAGSQNRNLIAAVEPMPDLKITLESVGVSPNPATEGQTVTVSVTVENVGNAPAGSFAVWIVITGPGGTALSQSVPVDHVYPDYGASVSATWTAVPGEWTVTVFADANHAVTELSEANNNATRTLTVQAGLSITLIAGVTILLVGVAVAVALIYRWRRRQPKEPQ